MKDHDESYNVKVGGAELIKINYLQREKGVYGGLNTSNFYKNVNGSKFYKRLSTL